jgi:hypothetical protein
MDNETTNMSLKTKKIKIIKGVFYIFIIIFCYY